MVHGGGISADPAKIEAITTLPRPANQKELQIFLGMANYYQRFVRNFAHVASPLTELLRKESTWEWGPAEEQVFTTLQKRLTEAPVLLVPDFTLPFQIGTDASMFAIGAELQ